MRPVDLSTGMPRSIDELAVEWDRLVLAATPLDREAPYLAALAHQGAKIFTHRFGLRVDTELEHLLSYLQVVAHLQPSFVPHVLARTAARETLLAFERDPFALEAMLSAAHFTYVSPFLLEGTLAEYLFWHGTYRHFYDERSANDARSLARSWLGSLGADDLEAVIPFQSRLPWGHWFEPHSVSDATFVLLHRGRHELLLTCITHTPT